MSEPLNLIDMAPVEASQGAVAVEIFDPPMCCPTGVCGPTLDQTLLNVNEMVMGLQAEGVAVQRYQMTSQPHVFLQSADVMRLVRERQMNALPITLVNKRVLKVGEYPTFAEVKAALNGASQ